MPVIFVYLWIFSVNLRLVVTNFSFETWRIDSLMDVLKGTTWAGKRCGGGCYCHRDTLLAHRIWAWHSRCIYKWNVVAWRHCSMADPKASESQRDKSQSSEYLRSGVSERASTEVLSTSTYASLILVTLRPAATTYNLFIDHVCILLTN